MTVQLVEREQVLDALSGHLVAVRKGQGRVVLLRGEAGVGKTAVLTAFAQLASGSAEVLWGWCEPLSTPRPLGPVLDVAGALDRRFGSQVSEGLDSVAGACQAMIDALRAGPAALLFEDVHWADAATFDLIPMLARRIDQIPVLLIMTYRDDELDPGHSMRSMLGYLAGLRTVHRHVVEPLTRDGVAQLAGGRVSTDEMYRVTGGNPFFVTEVLGSGDGIPDTVRDAVSGRMARVSSLARRTAELVAVIGAQATPDRLNAVLGDDGGCLAELIGAGILVGTGTGVAFRHELTRQAVLETVPAFTRVALHARVLEILSADPRFADDLSLLAHHAAAADDSDAVLRYAPAAATRAAALGAHREAAAHFEQALRWDHLLSPERRAELLEGLAHEQLHTQFTVAVDRMEQALELRRQLGDSLAEGNDLRWLSALCMPMGRCADAWRLGQEALRILETLPQRSEAAWAHLNLCQLSAYDQRGLESAQEHAQRAMALASAMGAPDVVWQARFHVAATTYACADSGQDAAWAEMERARLGARRAGLAELASYLTMQAAWLAAPRRDHRTVAAMLDELEAEAGDRGVLSPLLCARGFRTLGLLHTGAWDEAADLATSVLKHPHAPPVARLIPLTVLGLIRTRRGDPDGQDLLDEARTSYERSGWTLFVDAARSEAAWLAGDSERAAAEAQPGLAAVTPHTSPWCAGEVARWTRFTGARTPPVRVAEPFALELSGAWREAAAEWDRRGHAYDAALARLEGDLPALLRALETFQALGARAAAGVTRNRLRELGHRTGSRGPRPSTRSNRHGLTARQVEILQLVAEGLTDAQIAARLHLSAKTVNNHVGAVLTKLDVHTRSDAVRKLAGS